MSAPSPMRIIMPRAIRIAWLVEPLMRASTRAQSDENHHAPRDQDRMAGRTAHESVDPSPESTRERRKAHEEAQPNSGEKNSRSHARSRKHRLGFPVHILALEQIGPTAVTFTSHVFL